MAKPSVKNFQISVSGPFGLKLASAWQLDKAQQKAAWEMYVELVTRISVQELKPGHGSIREALISIYSLFGSTREILRKYGPDVARGKGKYLTFGRIAIIILNQVLRPFLTKWHPELEAYEATRGEGESRSKHERIWDQADAFYTDLAQVREVLRQWSDELARVLEIDSLHEPHQTTKE